jgi:peptide/nickel transport system substrate-binding protein
MRYLLGFLLLAMPAMAATPRDALVIAMNIDAVITLDNAQIGELASDEIFSNACDGLLQRDANDINKILPNLAQSWTVSPDLLTYTFKLKPGLVHTSGNKVTAEDVAWQAKRTLWLNFGNAAQFTTWGFSAATADEDFKALDETTLQVKVGKPYPPALVLNLFTGRQGVALDRVEILKHVAGNDFGNAWLKTNLACFGPWKLGRWNAGESLTLDRNESYPFEKPKLRRVVFRNVTESTSQRLLLEKGDVDMARALNAEDLRALESSTTTRLVRTPAGLTTYLGFNVSDPILGNPKVREAFRYLIDYKGLQDTVMFYSGIARATPVPLGAFGALSQEEGQPFRLDLDRARALLAEAGYAGGFSKEIITYAYSPYAEIAQHVQANAAKIGVTLKVTPLVSAQHLGRNRAREFDIAVLDWGDSTPDSDGMLSRHATNPDNRIEARQTMYPAWRSAFTDAWFNQAIPAARMEQNEAKRLAMYHEIATRLLHEGPMAYMFQGMRNIRLSNTVKDMVLTTSRIIYASAVK